MSDPLVSIIIPVAAAHRQHAATAVASCRWQTIGRWECILVNDTGRPLTSEGDPRIRVIDAPTHVAGKRRASVARNAGLEVARGTFTTYLDSDDYLLPSGLESLVRGHAAHAQAYSYAHHYGLNRMGAYAQYRPREYDREALKHYNLHPITALVPTDCLRDVGGCDEDAAGLEDWTVWLRLAIAGWCGERVYGPTFVYRRDEGINHIPDVHGGQALMDAVTAPYRDSTGDIPMAGCGCGGGAARAKATARAFAGTLGALPMTDEHMATLEYIGPGLGKQSFKHPVSKQEYRAGRGPAVRYIRVPLADVDYLVKELRLFQRVMPPAAFVPPPDPGTVAKGTLTESVTAGEVDADAIQFEEPKKGKASTFPGKQARKA